MLKYALPPNGEVVLGASFDQGVYYVENGKYYDLEGREVDLVPALDSGFPRVPEIIAAIDWEAERDLQEQVDQGHKPMMLDPIQVAYDFISRQGDASSSNVKMTSAGMFEEDNRIAAIEIIGDYVSVKRVYLKKLIRQDPTGIWTIVGYDQWNPEEDTKVILENKPDMISDLDMNISGRSKANRFLISSIKWKTGMVIYPRAGLRCRRTEALLQRFILNLQQMVMVRLISMAMLTRTANLISKKIPY